MAAVRMEDRIMTTFADLEREIPLGGRIMLVASDGQPVLEADYLPGIGWTVSDYNVTVSAARDEDAHTVARQWLACFGPSDEPSDEIMILGEVQS